jgi:hypothetical protein
MDQILALVTLSPQAEAEVGVSKQVIPVLRGVLAEVAELHRVLAQRVKATAVERLTVLMAVVVEVLAVQALQRRLEFSLPEMVGLVFALPLQGNAFSMLVAVVVETKTILVIAAV